MSHSQQATPRTGDGRRFTDRQWGLTTPNEGGLGDLIDNQRAGLRGVIPCALHVFGQQPADGETITIGGQVFEFDAATPPVAGGGASHIAVYRGANTAAAIANLVKAINDLAEAAKWTEGDGNTTVPTVVADAFDSTHLRVLWADERGGTAIPDVPTSTALATTVGGASKWSVANMTAAGGKKLTDQDVAVVGPITVTAAMVSYGAIQLRLPIPVHGVVLTATAADGTLLHPSTQITIGQDQQDLTLSIGGPAAFIATDVINLMAW